jgi:hypothetical protein
VEVDYVVSSMTENMQRNGHSKRIRERKLSCSAPSSRISPNEPALPICNTQHSRLMCLPMRNNPLGPQVRDRYPSFFVACVEEMVVGRERAAVDGMSVGAEDVGWRRGHRRLVGVAA